MGVKASNRGTQAIRNQIDAEVKANERRFGYQFEKEIARMGDTIEKQTAEIEQLKAELDRVKNAYERRKAELAVAKDELQEANKSRDYWKALGMDFLRAFQSLEKKHRKLSAIVRLGLTPERYHELRKDIEADYPEFA
jgi:predicted RNase H-like nuclease (RuvC/YqgF family)